MPNGRWLFSESLLGKGVDDYGLYGKDLKGESEYRKY
jgi:hypothetical protein